MKFVACLGLIFRFLLLFNFLGLVMPLSPGAQIHITQAGIDRAIHSMLQQVLVRSDSFRIPDFKTSRVKFFELSGSINLAPQNAGIRLLNNGDILVHINSMSLEARGKTKADLYLFRTGTHLHVKSENTYLEITLGIINENGRLRTVNKGVRFDISKLHIYARRNILSRIMEKVLDAFRGIFRERINKEVINVINIKIQEFSDRLVRIDMEKPLGGRLRDFFIDYGLTSNPSVVNSVLTIPVATQFWYNGHKNEAPVQSSGPYPFGAPWQMVCIDFDTNVVFGTASYAYKLREGPPISKTFTMHLSEELKNDWLNKSIGCNCTDFFCPVHLVAEFSEFCSTNPEIKIKMTNEDRQIHFNNSGVFLSLSGIGSVYVVSKNTTTQILNAEVAVDVHIMENLTIENWIAKGTARVFKSRLSADSPLLGKIDEKVLDEIWESDLKAHIEKWITEFSQPGIPLPSLKFANFYNTRVGFNGPFMRLCSDVDIKFELCSAIKQC